MTVRRYRYVGPLDVLAAVRPGREGRAIGSQDDLAAWLGLQGSSEPFTFVVDLAGVLRLAPRRSEHVACAGGSAVLGAGEITFARDGERWAVEDISNQSTGYCPDLTSWAAVRHALDRAGLAHPGRFTAPIVFRLCPGCHERNLVKDGHFACAICGAALPERWNFGAPGDGS
ncbi:hypothetical protein [Actinomadura sp. DC4]|uniref:hypothetical protein n=1 Tax=Actinomadura sp. DC4 TaxID=3055069 RepID=UPI0025B006D8|nr:hypothetical protein [Actinomadura sp. DC4]MDN3358888.1 hypothetical protein [Actinomadura sp. DC4]